MTDTETKDKFWELMEKSMGWRFLVNRRLCILKKGRYTNNPAEWTIEQRERIWGIDSNDGTRGFLYIDFEGFVIGQPLLFSSFEEAIKQLLEIEPDLLKQNEFLATMLDRCPAVENQRKPGE